MQRREFLQAAALAPFLCYKADAAPDGPRAVAPLTDFAGYPLAGRTFLLSLRWDAARSNG